MSMLTPLAPPPVLSCDRMLPKGTAMLAGFGASGGMKPAGSAQNARERRWSSQSLLLTTTAKWLSRYGVETHRRTSMPFIIAPKAPL